MVSLSRNLYLHMQCLLYMRMIHANVYRYTQRAVAFLLKATSIGFSLQMRRRCRTPHASSLHFAYASLSSTERPMSWSRIGTIYTIPRIQPTASLPIIQADQQNAHLVDSHRMVVQRRSVQLGPLRLRVFQVRLGRPQVLQRFKQILPLVA